jgi:hypothetical protein
MVAGALAELHLDSRSPHRLGELGELGREVVAARFEQRYDLISFQGDLQGRFRARPYAANSRVLPQRYAPNSEIPIIPGPPASGDGRPQAARDNLEHLFGGCGRFARLNLTLT